MEEKSTRANFSKSLVIQKGTFGFVMPYCDSGTAQ